MRTAVVLPLQPQDALDRLRAVLHAADLRVRRDDACPLPEGPAAPPHIMLAYADQRTTADELEVTLAQTAVDVSFDVRDLSLVRLTRSYRWDVLARIALLPRDVA